MSINITVHGNPVKTTNRSTLLEDSERVKKEQEHKRRILRLQQVRQQSDKLTKKIRENVSAEKEKQLRHVEDIKAREMEMWHQNVLAKTKNDYSASIFQVGEAHRAAQAENCRMKEKMSAGRMQRISHKGRLAQKDERKKTKVSGARKEKENLCKNANVQTDHLFPNVCVQSYGRSTSTSEGLHGDNLVSDTSEILDCTSNSSTTDSDSSEESTLTPVGPKRPHLSRSQSVILEVSSESSSEAALTEMEDNFHESNVRVSRMVSKAPSQRARSVERPKNPTDQKRVTKQITKRKSSPLKVTKDTTKTPPNSPRKESKSQSPLKKSSPPKTRFTQISDYLKQREQEEKQQKELEKEVRVMTPPPVRKTVQMSLSQGQSKTTTLSSSTSLKSQPSRVQFYDYNNKFQKEYPQPPVTGVLHRGAEELNRLSAIEQAKIERQLEEARKTELEKKRLRTEERSQKALEKEKIRRDCEDLTAKLEALTKDRPPLHSNEVNLFSETRIDQHAKEKQNQLKSAVEDILKRPVVITCPEIGRSTRPLPSTHQLPAAYFPPPEDSVNLGSAFRADTQNLSNGSSSESCCSILLKLTDQKEQISDDIIKFEGSSEKVEKLKNLLERINALRACLMEEIQKADEQPDTAQVQNFLDSIGRLRAQRDEILSEKSKKAQKDPLTKREELLKKREAVLEREVRKLYEMQMKRKKKEKTREEGSAESLEVDIEDEEHIIRVEKPVEIVIKVKDGIKKKYPKSPRKVATLISPVVKKKKATQKRVRLDKNRIEDVEVESVSTSSTSYREIPVELTTELGNALKEQAKPELTKKGKTVKLPEVQKSLPVAWQSQPKKLNPLLVHYIQRLLGMSRNSINALGVSSSSIETPSTSIVNTTANQSVQPTSTGDLNQADKERIDRLQRFIQDNHSLISEIEDSLHNSKSSSIDESMKTIEDVWMKSLKEKSMPKPKPILKKVDDPKPTQSKMQLVGAYNELTDNCTQRIAKLTEMINQVRKEKQKILEITLSSVSETGRNSTEYMDFMQKHQQTNEDKSQGTDVSSKILDSQKAEEVEEAVHLEKNKLTGASRDSGISLSRPVTALDVRDSPLPDLESSRKLQKPPPAIARYSPQLVEDVPHELSTILEVDTPATSRLNASIKTTAQQPANETKAKEILEQLRLNAKLIHSKFPSFEQYAKEHNVDLSQIQPELSLQVEHEFEQLLSQAGSGQNIIYEEFPSIRTYLKKCDSIERDDVLFDELVESLRILNLSFQKFPSSKEYFANISGHSNLVDSKSLEDLTQSPETGETENLSDTFKGITEELLRRNILTKPFQNEMRSSSDGHPDTQSSEKPGQSNPQAMSGVEELQVSSNQSLIDELNQMGLKWGSRMLKKTQESQALSSSTSSSFVFTPRREKSYRKAKKSPRKELNDTTLNSTTTAGRPLNLREFFTKELQKLANETSNSLSSTDDSMASLLLRSILGSLTPSPRPANNGTTDRQKTSTPVPTNSSSVSGQSSKLFSGESRLSSVHFNENNTINESKTDDKTTISGAGPDH